MITARERYAGMRSILEVPILNEKFWSKVPEVRADAIMIDMEDSATPENKSAVRARVVEQLEDLSYFGGRTVIVRVNNLGTPWGKKDLQSLAPLSTNFLVSYPKVETAGELLEVMSILKYGTQQHELHVMVETARAVIELDRIASTPGVAGLHFGYIDYAADVGSRAFNAEGTDLFDDSRTYVRPKISAAAAAYGLFATGGTLIPDFRDLDKVARFVGGWANSGFTACIAVSPAHLGLVEKALMPTEDEIAQAQIICEGYERALEAGHPAAVLNGRVVTLPDYRVATLVLARSGLVRGPGASD